MQRLGPGLAQTMVRSERPSEGHGTRRHELNSSRRDRIESASLESCPFCWLHHIEELTCCPAQRTVCCRHGLNDFARDGVEVRPWRRRKVREAIEHLMKELERQNWITGA